MSESKIHETVRAVLRPDDFGLLRCDLIWRIETDACSINFCFRVEIDTLEFANFVVRRENVISEKSITDLAQLHPAHRSLMDMFLARPDLPDLVNNAVVDAVDRAIAGLQKARARYKAGYWPHQCEDDLLTRHHQVNA
ncbi:MAG: hypothetical protein IT320_16160 [Anaerolineae bacterium]|nr:hypothetical protein [Anaerolineae bacterium]